MPFQITVHAYDKVVPNTILDEGASVSVMPSTTWQALGSSQLVPLTQNLLAFHVACFPHDRRMVTIDQLSFFSPSIPPEQLSSPLGSCSQVVPSFPQVNYVATRSISTSADDHANDLVHHVLGALEPDLSLVPHDMYSS